MIEVLAHPKHKEYRDLRERVGPYFSPERFDIGLVNRDLRGAGTRAFRRKRERFCEGR